MSDVIESKISAVVANASVNAAGKLLKTVEMQHKYGTPSGAGKTLNLCARQIGGEGVRDDPKDDHEEEIAQLEARLAQLRGG